jgi:phosphatidylserine/phosphatidylglycerophosphate/cardiolipin synthase-like enzyme
MRTLVLFVLFGVCISARAQSDRIRVYFNQNTDPTVSTGTLAISLFNAMDDTIEAYIDRAQYTIDVAMYNADDVSIISALNSARSRGVQVRYIAEGTNSNSALNSLNPLIPVLERTDGLGSGMHNKFMSIDADHADVAWLWTGSTNWTQSGLFSDYNNMVFIQDQALALAYRTEFEEMWGGNGPQPNIANSKFGAAKTNNTPHTFQVDGVPIECWFSPSDGTTSHLVNLLNDAQHTVRTAIYTFTNTSLGTALLNADQRPGVEVHMDLEYAITAGTEGAYLASNGVDVVTHSSDNVLLHHKYAIIDEDSADDPLVITGSHNWTNYAETVNDENAIAIHDATVANLFYQEWHARRNDVVGVAEEFHNALQLWPTLAANDLWLRVPVASVANLRVMDAMGREVKQQQLITGSAQHIAVNDLRVGSYVAIVTSGQRNYLGRFCIAR